MSRTRRRSSEPTQSPSGSGPAQQPDEQDLRGNQAAQDALFGSAGVHSLDGHNDVQGPTATTDPEAPQSSRHLAPRAQWDGRRILDQWSQIDASQSTRTELDGRRCGPQSVLAVHVMSGPEAIASVASAARSSISALHDPDARSLAQRHEAALTRLGRTSQLEQWTYDDLNELAEVLYVIANDGTTFEASGVDGSSTNNEELARITGLGGEEAGAQARPRGGAAGVLDALGIGGLAPEIAGTGFDMTGEAALHGLPTSGRFNGTSALQGLQSQLSQRRNVALIIGTAGPGAAGTMPSEEEAPNVLASREQDQLAGVVHNRIAHGVTLGSDSSGQVYLYDPWPREGAQRLTGAAMDQYFQGDWAILGRVAAARGARQPGNS